MFHTAPGMEWMITLRTKTRPWIYCPVGDNGRYIDDGRIPTELVG